VRFFTGHSLHPLTDSAQALICPALILTVSLAASKFSSSKAGEQHPIAGLRVPAPTESERTPRRGPERERGKVREVARNPKPNHRAMASRKRPVMA